MRANLMSGQAHGKVDWISADGSEVGTYIRVSPTTSAKCILVGDSIKQAVANKKIEVGSLVTGFGEVYARCATNLSPAGKPVGELICEAFRVTVEPPTIRSRGSLNVAVKGVVMWCSPDLSHFKTFFNYTTPKKPVQLVCVVELANHFNAMSQSGSERFIEMLKVGRDFTMSGSASVDAYLSHGIYVPVIRLNPGDFKLQS
jgi:hypothetical protein